MKYFTFLLTPLFLFSLSLQAQLSVGGGLGLNIASISVDPEPSTEDYSSRLAMIFGGLVDYSLADNMQIRSGLVITGKGAKVEEGNTNGTFKLTYLEIPILFRYLFEIASGQIQPYVTAGPTVGFLMSAKIEVNDREQDIKDETKGIDFGISFGGGVNAPREGFTPFAELRYSIGLANWNDEANESSVKNNGFMIIIGAMVPLDISG